MYELREVVRHQHQAFAACVTGNVQVIHSDGLAQLFQGGTDGAVMRCSLGAVGQYFQAAANLIEHGPAISFFSFLCLGTDTRRRYRCAVFAPVPLWC
jgi:hypothetical protein